MLIPRYLVGSDLEPFPFQSVFSFELPHAVGKSKFAQRFSASLWMTWSMIGCSHFLRISGSMSLLALPDFSWWRCFWISSIYGTSKNEKKPEVVWKSVKELLLKNGSVTSYLRRKFQILNYQQYTLTSWSPQDLPTPQLYSTPPQPTGPYSRMLQSWLDKL